MDVLALLNIFRTNTSQLSELKENKQM